MFPGGSSGSGERASFGARLGASLLDSLLYGLVSLIPAIAGIVAIVASFSDCSEVGYYSDGTEYTSCGDGELKVGMLLLGIALIGFGVVFVWLMQARHLAVRGQTWGRKIVGIKVVRADNGQPIGYGRAIGRLLFAGIISGSFCALGYLWMLWDKDKQTWHDKVVGSVVVRA
jgi:uncharacterized RDD family membrane protein YckC